MRIMEHLVASTAIYGNGLLVKRRPARGTPPTELWPLDWRRVEVFTTGTDMSPIDHYEYHTDYGAPETLQPKDVVHLQWWAAPRVSVFRRSSRCGLRLGNEAAASRYSTQSFTNSVRPSGALITPERLSQEQNGPRCARKSRWPMPFNAGGGRMLLLDNGLDWKAFGGSAAESQMVEVRRLNRDEVCAVYDIPPPMVGILDRATFSNIDEQHRMLYQDTLGPWLVLAEQTLGSQSVEPETGWAGLFCEFLLDDVLRGDIEKRSQAYQRMLGGVYTPNELRRAENQPRIDHPLADSIYLPLNMTPVGEGDMPEASEPAQMLEVVRALVGPSAPPAGNGH